MRQCFNLSTQRRRQVCTSAGFYCSRSRVGDRRFDLPAIHFNDNYIDRLLDCFFSDQPGYTRKHNQQQ
jgi:hypothetical protein